MDNTLLIEKIDQTYIKVNCEQHIQYELSDYFTFDVPGAKFMPAVRNRFWDGKIRLFSVKTGKIYYGLLKYIELFAKNNNYSIKYVSEFNNDPLSVHEGNLFVQSLNLPLQPRDYQIESFINCVRNKRQLVVSPTASGKSLIIYLLTRYYNARTLIIVPTTSLVSQLASDFSDYGYQSDKFIHRIFAGEDKQTDKPITISTWQSLYKLPKEFFKNFDVVIGDEAHLFQAKSLTTIMQKLVNTQYRFGFTGTLDGTQTHRLVLEGLFGSVSKTISTSQLIEKKHLAEFKIKCLVLKYPDNDRRNISKCDYHQEIDFIVRNNARNKFIKNLAISLEGNTLLLFQYVDKHGKVLYDLIANHAIDRNVYYVSGEVDGQTREQIRSVVEKENNAIIVASSGVFSTGINIRNLHNIIFSSPTKSRIRNLQSIGRGLRRSETKTQCTLFDIVDDLKYNQNNNFTLDHFVERVKIYNEENFPYKIYPVSLKD